MSFQEAQDWVTTNIWNPLTGRSQTVQTTTEGTTGGPVGMSGSVQTGEDAVTGGRKKRRSKTRRSTKKSRKSRLRRK